MREQSGPELSKMNSPARFIDHTLLKPDATKLAIANLCEEAVEYGFASVCIPLCHVSQASRLLYGSEVAVGTVVGFPFGNQTTEVKVFAARQAVVQGAAEIDMVIRLGSAREGDFETVQNDIKQVVDASDGAAVKVIIECCLFDEETKLKLTECVVAGGANYVKTSTGYAASGATVADVSLLTHAAAGRIKVKAAGGIRSWPACQELLAAGASRLGSSSGAIIMQQWYEHAELLCR